MNLFDFIIFLLYFVIVVLWIIGTAGLALFGIKVALDLKHELETKGAFVSKWEIIFEAMLSLSMFCLTFFSISFGIAAMCGMV